MIVRSGSLKKVKKELKKFKEILLLWDIQID